MTDKPKIELGLTEYLEGKFAEQTKLHDVHAEATNAHVKSVKDLVKTSTDSVDKRFDGVDKRFNDLRGFIGVLVAITCLVIGAVYLSNQNHSQDTEKAQET